jgi:hypothetical protein
MMFSKLTFASFLFLSQASAFTARRIPLRAYGRSALAAAAAQLHVSTQVIGAEKTESFRLTFATSAGKAMSPWHDVELKNEDGSYNMVRLYTARWFPFLY